MNRNIFTKFFKNVTKCNQILRKYNINKEYKIANINELESKIKKNYNGNFIVFERDHYNVLVTDQYVNIYTINHDIESFLKVKQIIIINDMENFLTSKMSIKRKELHKYIKGYEVI